MTKIIDPIDCAATRGAREQAISDHKSMLPLAIPAKAEAEYTVTDDDWTQAIDCAMSCLEEVFITRPQLDNAMQHAFAILSLRKLVGAKAEAEVGVRPQNGDDDAR